MGDRARLRELERRNRELETEVSFLEKKSQRTSRRNPGSKQVRVHRNDATSYCELRVSRRIMCEMLGVSKSGYYEWGCHERGEELDAGRASDALLRR